MTVLIRKEHTEEQDLKMKDWVRSEKVKGARVKQR